jgi:Protein kinase domain/AAA ATPase domain
MGNSVSASADAPVIVADRYRVEREIGRGATGQVLEVSDLHTGHQLALKRLLDRQHGEAPRRANHLKHEFRVLAGLPHPNVVAVHDYGLDHGQPYYTMELLIGSHPGVHGPLGFRDVCRLLIALGEPLSLLHSRRLVHRDLSPRNVLWVAPGTAKLIDFGALASMAAHQRPIGTPSCTAPEVWRREQLDGRADVFGLGALAYFALTGTAAYPARTHAQLPMVWQQPPKPPSELVPDIPAALDQLVLSMLSVDKHGRPLQLAEVMERALAIGELASAGELPHWQASLTTPEFLGREPELALARGVIARAHTGRGQVCIVSGVAGSGRSRMLEAIGAEAEAAGFAIARTAASLTAGGELELLRELAQALLAAYHERPRTLAELERLAADAPIEPADDGERVGLQQAFVDACATLSEVRPLCLCVDDVERSDGDGLRALAQLARRVSRQRTLIAAASTPARPERASPLSTLWHAATVLELGPLDAEQTAALVRTAFGGASLGARVAQWVQLHAAGLPGACMELLEYLVASGFASFETGRWQLLADIESLALPSSAAEQLEIALSGRDAGRALLSLLSLVPRPFPLELSDYVAALPEHEGHGTDALDDLVRARVVLATPQGYVVRDPAAFDWARARIGPVHANALHRLLARFYERLEDFDTSVAYHLFSAGLADEADRVLFVDTARARKRALDLVSHRRALGIPAATLEAMLEHRERTGASPAQCHIIRRILLTLASVGDVHLQRHAPALFAQLSRDVGLDLWDETDASQPDRARMQSCLERARARHEATPLERRGLPPSEAVADLVSCIGLAAALCTFSYDVAGARSIRELAHPLRDLSQTSRLIADSFEVTYEGLVLGARAMPLRRDVMAATAPGATGIEPTLRDAVHFGQAFYLAAELAAEGDAAALALAESLEHHPQYEALGLQVRRIHALAHGRFDAAQTYRRRREWVELRTERVDHHLEMSVLRELQASARCGDLLELGRHLARVEERAQRFAGWQPWAALARAQRQILTDAPKAAATTLETLLASLPPFGHGAWHVAMVVLAEAENELRQHARAQARVESVQEGARGLGIELETRRRLEAAGAIARAGLGEPKPAAEAVAQLIAEADAALGRDSLASGELREAACRIALLANDYRGFEAQLDALGETYAHHPGLRARHARWVRRGKQHFSKLIAVLERANAARDWSARLAAQAPLRASQDASDALLSSILEQLGSDAGRLYRLGTDEVELLSCRPDADESALTAAVQRCIERFREADDLQTDGETEFDLRDAHGRVYVPLWLSDPEEPHRVTGLALIQTTPERLSQLDQNFVRAVALYFKALG